jgi:hypothetical protein
MKKNKFVLVCGNWVQNSPSWVNYYEHRLATAKTVGQIFVIIFSDNFGRTTNCV